MSSKFQNSFTILISELSTVLFQRRCLFEWLSGNTPLKPENIFTHLPDFGGDYPGHPA